MLSTKNSTSCPLSRKSSATVRPVRATRARAPGGSFICPYTRAHLEPDRRAVVLVRVHVDLGLDHLVIEVVALAGPLADAREDRIAAMRLGDVVDQLHDQHGLADAGAAEEADLAALGVGRQKVDDLDARLEDLGVRRLLGIGRGRLVDGAGAFGREIGPASSTGSPMTFMMRPSVPSPTGTRMGWPVSVTAWPRVRPSDTSMAMQRTAFSPRCCATSSTSRLPLFEVSSAFRISGRWPSNFTSTTGPITCVTWPGERLLVDLVEAVVAGVLGKIVHGVLSALVRALRSCRGLTLTGPRRPR